MVQIKLQFHAKTQLCLAMAYNAQPLVDTSNRALKHYYINKVASVFVYICLRLAKHNYTITILLLRNGPIAREEMHDPFTY